jgi:hypothetical protein
VAMNVLLWRSEYGSHAGEMPVPARIVWHKILTAPDASSLSVYQHGERMGYCEFATSVGQEMATFEGNAPPPDGLVKRAGYQIHLAGNVALGDFTNRLKFDSRIQFRTVYEWKEFNLKISSHSVFVELQSVATNQTVHIKISSDGAVIERNVPFDELRKPNLLLGTLAGDFAGNLIEALDLPEFSSLTTSQNLEWQACRTRVRIGSDYVPIYRLETQLLGRDVVMDIGTLGEILRVQLPGDINAHIDEWSRQ